MITEEMCRKADDVLAKTLSIRAALASCESELLAQGMEKADSLLPAIAGDRMPNRDAAYGHELALQKAGLAIRASAAQTREGKG